MGIFNNIHGGLFILIILYIFILIVVYSYIYFDFKSSNKYYCFKDYLEDIKKHINLLKINF